MLASLLYPQQSMQVLLHDAVKSYTFEDSGAKEVNDIKKGKTLYGKVRGNNHIFSSDILGEVSIVCLKFSAYVYKL